MMARQTGTQQAPVQVEQQAPAPAPAPPVPPKEPEAAARPAIPDAPEPKDWEQKYRVLQGKYNHEVPRLQQDLKQLRGELASAVEEIGRLKSQPKPEAPPPANVKPEEIEQYGPEFVDFVRRVAGEASPKQTKADTSDLEKRVQTAEDVARHAVQRQFFTDLTSMVPDWEQKNTDDGFLRWLDEVDPMTGSARQAVFDDAYARLDVNRVAAFFKAYGGNVGAAPSGTPPSMVTPSTVRGQSDVPQGKKLWQQREIAAFYTDLRAGRISAEDAARTETEIFAAQNEGRIR